MLREEADGIGKKEDLLAAIIVVFILIYVILRASSRLNKILGETGINVMMRLMGLTLMVIAVEVFVGVSQPRLASIIHSGIDFIQ